MCRAVQRSSLKHYVWSASLTGKYTVIPGQDSHWNQTPNSLGGSACYSDVWLTTSKDFRDSQSNLTRKEKKKRVDFSITPPSLSEFQISLWNPGWLMPPFLVNLKTVITPIRSRSFILFDLMLILMLFNMPPEKIKRNEIQKKRTAFSWKAKKKKKKKKQIEWMYGC